MQAIELTFNRRFFGKKTIRRDLPTGWKDLMPSRRIFIFKKLLTGGNDEPSRLEALRAILSLPRHIWNALAATDLAALLDRMDWLKAEHSPRPVFDRFNHRGVEYFCASDDFTNGTCLEYPFADEYARAFLATGDASELLKLTATLYREMNPDATAVLKREDQRVPIYSRAEVEQRAQQLQGLDEAIQYAALLYFVGVQSLIHKLYGSELFEQENGEAEGERPAPDPLGWWALYLDQAAGDPVKLEAIQQSNFHTFCLMEVRKRKQAREAIMRQKMHSPDWAEK